MRICYNLLLKITVEEMKTVNSIFDQARLDKREGFIDFLKRHHLMEEIVALHSRSIAV